MSKQEKMALLGLVILCLFWGAFIYYLFYCYTSTPYVQMSYPDGECIGVDPPSAGTCENPPKVHIIQWVAPEEARRSLTNRII